MCTRKISCQVIVVKKRLKKIEIRPSGARELVYPDNFGPFSVKDGSGDLNLQTYIGDFIQLTGPLVMKAKSKTEGILIVM